MIVRAPKGFALCLVGKNGASNLHVIRRLNRDEVEKHTVCGRSNVFSWLHPGSFFRWEWDVGAMRPCLRCFPELREAE